jgi:hypothetical protein
VDIVSLGSINIQAQIYVRLLFTNGRRPPFLKINPKNLFKKTSHLKPKRKVKALARPTYPNKMTKEGLEKADSLFKTGQHIKAFPLYLDYKDTPLMKASSLKI